MGWTRLGGGEREEMRVGRGVAVAIRGEHNGGTESSNFEEQSEHKRIYSKKGKRGGKLGISRWESRKDEEEKKC